MGCVIKVYVALFTPDGDGPPDDVGTLEVGDLVGGLGGVPHDPFSSPPVPCFDEILSTPHESSSSS